MKEEENIEERTVHKTQRLRVCGTKKARDVSYVQVKSLLLESFPSFTFNNRLEIKIKH